MLHGYVGYVAPVAAFVLRFCIEHYTLALRVCTSLYALRSRVALPLCRACASCLLSRSCVVELALCCALGVRVALALSVVRRTCIAHSHFTFVVCARMSHLHLAFAYCPLASRICMLHLRFAFACCDYVSRSRVAFPLRPDAFSHVAFALHASCSGFACCACALRGAPAFHMSPQLVVCVGCELPH